MKHRYLPMTETDKKEMLQTIGIDSVEELFSDIPEKVRFKREYDIKPALSETDLMKELSALAAMNADSLSHATFIGAGVYDHYKPVVVDHVISRSEFYTAYTPYQPELSQGELQALVSVTDVSDDYALLALQGPLAQEILSRLTDEPLEDIKFFRFREGVEIAGHPALVSRTGYTGEDGFEIYTSPESARALWTEILRAGEPDGLLPAGLGARDTLRFEAGLPLYGQELSDSVSPLEAGLGFVVKLGKEEDFIGKEALARQKEAGVPRKVAGLEMIDKGIPRTGYAVYKDGEKVGEVTTGTQSPTIGKNVGNALIRAEYANPGEELEVEVRKRRLKAKVVETPFYKRPKSQ
nr:glycine cleavage system aminomethyltransferase GcvT [Bhargavaea cecembensis]